MPRQETKPIDMPLLRSMCATCPFKVGSPHQDLAPGLATSALSSASRICHSTGKNALKQTNKPEALCRGARDLQLKFFHSIGFLPEPTDAAWKAKFEKIRPQFERSAKT